MKMTLAIFIALLMAESAAPTIMKPLYGRLGVEAVVPLAALSGIPRIPFEKEASPSRFGIPKILSEETYAWLSTR